MLQSLITLFKRDLENVKTELLAYNNENSIWLLDKSISNSAGNLALHLVGNLNCFIGAKLGHTGFIRQRDLEFSQQNIPVSEICMMIDDTIRVVTETLLKLSPEDLQKEYRRRIDEDYMTTEYFLLHLKSHLSYHLGQINYHRRLLD